MLNFFQIMDSCAGIEPIVRIIKNGVFPIIQIGIPILLVLFGTIDLGKAVVANDEKEIKGATSKLIKRAIMALAVFFVVFLVNLVFGWIGKSGESTATGHETDWYKCWNSVVIVTDNINK